MKSLLISLSNEFENFYKKDLKIYIYFGLRNQNKEFKKTVSIILSDPSCKYCLDSQRYT